MTPLLLGGWWIPWDLLSTGDRTAIAWAAAALAAAGPSAIAALLWVQAWRGSPRFGAPRCARCSTELLAAGRTLPEQCPECGFPTEERGRRTVHYARRRWRVRGACTSFAGGALGFLLAIGAAWSGGVLTAYLARESGATARVEAVEAALIGHPSHRAATDALRFAADSAAESAAVREAGRATVEALLADAIPADRGLSLLLDRLDSEVARGLLMDLTGALAEAKTIDEATAMAILARVRGGPAVRAWRGRDADDGSERIFLALHAGDPEIDAVAERVELDGRAVEFRRHPIDSSPAVRFGAVLSVAFDGASAAEPAIAVDWSLRWRGPMPTVTNPEDAPALLSATAPIRLSVSRRDEPRLGSALPEPEAASPFLAKGLRPRVQAEPLGGMLAISVQLRAAVRPGWSYSAGAGEASRDQPRSEGAAGDVGDGAGWALIIGERSVPLAAVYDRDSGTLQLSVASARQGLLTMTVPELPETVSIRYSPPRSGSQAAAQTSEIGTPPGLPPWPRPVEITGLRWSRGR